MFSFENIGVPRARVLWGMTRWLYWHQKCSVLVKPAVSLSGGKGTAGPDLRRNMKNMVKIAAIAIAAQACLAAAAAAGPALSVRPVAVSVSVAELSGAADAISAAMAGGDDRKAERLISDLFSGGAKFEKAAPVYAEKAAPEPKAAEKAEDKEPAAAWVPAPPAPVSHNISDPAVAAAAAEEERAEALKLKGFAWGVTILTVALIFLIILL